MKESIKKLYKIDSKLAIQVAKILGYKIKAETSEEYFMNRVLPILRKKLFSVVNTKGFKLRGRGKVNRKRGEVELIIDAPKIKNNPNSILRLSGNYMTKDDNEYYILLTSPYLLSVSHETHDKFKRNPDKDTKSMLSDINDLLDDWKGYLEEGIEANYKTKARKRKEGDARMAYQDAEKEVGKKMKTLHELMVRHKREFLDDYTNWDMVGDISHLSEVLSELINSLKR